MSHNNVEMDGQKVALSIAVVILGIVCFIIGTVAVAIPHWGTFSSRYGDRERGNYGPWKMCKDLGFGREICGQNISSFKPIFAVQAAGICAAIGIAALGFYCLLSLLQIAMQVTRSRIMCKYSHIIIAKLLFIVTAALFTLTAVSLFATQGNDLESGFIVEVRFSFYMEVVVTIFTFILMLLAVSEYCVSRRMEEPYGGAEERAERSGVGLGQVGFGTTIGNPGFRDRLSANGISVTDSSVRFVPSANKASRNKNKNNKNRSNGSSNNNHNHGVLWNGSVTSMSPASNGSSMSVISSMSTVSTVASTTRGQPLRSSLKKSKTADGFGIQNPGFSGTSPTLSRTGSLKKVRIQTQTTDV